MAVGIVMPRLSDSMEEGTVIEWKKSVGDEVAVGEALVEVETDKANMVYEADTAGVLIELVADEGDTLPIGEVIAWVGEGGETPNGERTGVEKTGSEAQAGEAGEGTAREGAGAVPGGAKAEPHRREGGPALAATKPFGDRRVKASPIARRIAEARGIELHRLSGSGPSGRIVKADVEWAAGTALGQEAPEGPDLLASRDREEQETAKGRIEAVELSKLQSTVARRMAISKATAPHFYLESQVDMTRAVQARDRLKETARESEVAPTLNDMIVKASAIALREHPNANGAYCDARIERYSRVNVGIAVAARDALVVPTIFDADRKGLQQIAEDSRLLAGRVRDGTITPPELSGGTFTVSNLGMFGITSFQAVINPPQAAILSVGALCGTPVIDESGGVFVKPTMTLGLACDHRVLYGAGAAQFLRRICDLLAEPMHLAY